MSYSSEQKPSQAQQREWSVRPEAADRQLNEGRARLPWRVPLSEISSPEPGRTVTLALSIVTRVCPAGGP
jgi:hypothetical protein